ncbi:carbohydrate esterase family 4 protein [Armillaria solidipes]|uniref:Carbohydrate esterase family 4 protein n=1 Tax=Armillaria solidipes TaxID=1076256 RepID=A0A2H3BW64_9AGAR|nr:carbohydrate esterase family 4 protein [Armillaria solidipes]
MLSSAVLTIALATAAFSHPTKRQTGGGVITSCTVPNTAALTFDDGPYIYSQNTVDILDAKGVKGTFFISTYHIGCIIELTGSNPLSNCSDGNNLLMHHTWAHKDLATLTTDQVCPLPIDNKLQLTVNTVALEKILGVKVAFMRPPYGSYNSGVLQVAAAHNQSVIIWDFDSGDSVGETAANSEKDYDTLVAKHPSTILTLNHETVGDTTVLPHALDDLLGAGYNLVTVAECLGLPPYLSVVAPSTQDASWTCSNTN